MKKLVNGQLLDMTAEEIAARQAEETAWEKEQKNIVKEKPYVQQRKNSYPKIGDQLDMLWHSIDQNSKLKSEYFEFYEAIKAVKIKYPK